jgi:CHAT domain-containing protein
MNQDLRGNEHPAQENSKKNKRTNFKMTRHNVLVIVLIALAHSEANPLLAQASKQNHANTIRITESASNASTIEKAQQCTKQEWSYKHSKKIPNNSLARECYVLLIKERGDAVDKKNWQLVVKMTKEIIKIKDYLLNEESRSISGIGVLIVDQGNGIYKIQSVIKDSPADIAQLKQGDQITRIDGRITKQLSLDETIQLIRGPTGSRTHITINQAGKILTKQVRRNAIKVHLEKNAENYFGEYLVLYEAYFNLGMAAELIEIFPTFEQLLHEKYLNDRRYLGEAYEKKALAESKLKRYEDALISIDKSMHIYTDAYGLKSSAKARASKIKTDILIELGRDTEAQSLIIQAKEIFQYNKSIEERLWVPYIAETINVLGYRCNFGKLERRSCHKFNNDGYEFAQKYLRPTESLFVDIIMSHGYSLLLNGEANKALKVYTESLMVLKKYHKQDLKRIVPIMNIMGGLYENNNPDKAESIYQEIVDMLQSKEGASSFNAQSGQLRLADWYAREGIIDKSTTLFKKVENSIRAHSTYKSQEEDLKIIGLLETLTKGYMTLGLFKDAGNIAIKTIDISRRYPKITAARLSLLSASSIYAVTKGDYINSLQKQLMLKDLLESKREEIKMMLSMHYVNPDYFFSELHQKLLSDISVTYALLSDFASAIDWCNKAIILAEKYTTVSFDTVVSLYMRKASLQMAKGDLVAAGRTVKTAMDLNLKTNTKIQHTPDLYLLAGVIAAAAGENDLAFRRFTEYTNTTIANLRSQTSNSSQDLRRQIIQSRMNLFSYIYNDYKLGSLLDRAALHARLNLHGISVEVEKALLRRTDGVTNPEIIIPTATSRSNVESPLIKELEIVDVDTVAKQLSKEAILIEFQKYSVYPRVDKLYRKDEPKKIVYIALILSPNGKVTRYNLGDATDIDRLVSNALNGTAANNVDSLNLWMNVSSKLFKPLSHALYQAKEIYITPDSELTRVPFLVLPNPSSANQLLSERFSIRILSTGKDLLRLNSSQANDGVSYVFANPDYGNARQAMLTSKSPVKHQNVTDNGWRVLAFTSNEGLAVANLLNAYFAEGSQASVANIKSIRSPKVLHISTHGYFLGNLNADKNFLDYLRYLPAKSDNLTSGPSNPLERSGLVLAGANISSFGDSNDGYLSASEVASLNLSGTELVVLSACSTALGELFVGDGVYGLQRSLAVAGARSTLLSLWKVDDSATAEFMINFYKRLKVGEARDKALLNTQKDFRTGLIGNGKWKDPYYWAAWQLIGDWRPINGL